MCVPHVETQAQANIHVNIQTLGPQTHTCAIYTQVQFQTHAPCEYMGIFQVRPTPC